MISYAQNFEDVLLDRCFRDVEEGFYIDIGAWHPQQDSVTHHFYTNGWSGINVEPSAEYFELLRAARPRDVNLRMAVSDTEDAAASFTVFDGGGISTLRELPGRYLVNLESRGFTASTVEVPATTLSHICAEYVPHGRIIDFLKIDVEGWEEAVLRGGDWKKWRPQVLVIEAITPVDFDETTGRDVFKDLSGAWQDIIQDIGYVFALNDGVNCFYVREESSYLLDSLRVPVNTLDEAVHYLDYERKTVLMETEQAVERLSAEVAGLEGALRRVLAEVQVQAERIESLESSTSWRVTKPVRRLGELLHHGRGSSVAEEVLDPLLRGVNVVGHFTDTSGHSEATRSTARCLEAAGLPISTLDVGPTSPLGEGFEPTWTDHTLPYGVTVIHDNIAHAAEQAPLYSMTAGTGYTVGFWYWELEDLPSPYVPAFELVDEVWAPSHFVRQSLQPHTDKPVTVVPPSVDFRAPDRVDRSAFGLPDDRFLFLTMGSVYSVLERKNPLAALRAFEMAFDPKDPVGLVIKVTDLHHRPDVAEALREAAARAPVYVLEERLLRNDVHHLLAAVDAYVSLHRSEGFGLPIAEAMALGKPVLATAYSGSMDFTSPEANFLVPYELVEIEREYNVFPAGFRWAEPDVEAAAAQMRTAAIDHEESRRVAAAGQALVRARCNPSVGAEVIRGRLQAIAAPSRRQR